MAIEIPEVPELRGESAVKALSDVVTELKAQKGRQLTAQQAEALIKIAEGMISSIQVEKEKGKPEKKARWSLLSRSKTRGTP